MGVSNGYNTALTRNGEFGKDFDKEVIQWKEEIEKDYCEIKRIQKQSNCSLKEASEIRRLRNPFPLLYKVCCDFYRLICFIIIYKSDILEI